MTRLIPGRSNWPKNRPGKVYCYRRSMVKKRGRPLGLPRAVRLGFITLTGMRSPYQKGQACARGRRVANDQLCGRVQYLPRGTPACRKEASLAGSGAPEPQPRTRRSSAVSSQVLHGTRPRTSSSRHRQDRYLQALDVHCAALKITTGRFQKQARRCWSCGTQWITYEEKESDVNLAIALVEDAALDRFDTALVISGDSDLVPAVRAAKRLRPQTEVVAVFPPGRASDPLRNVVDRTLHIDHAMLRRSQLPDEVTTPNGIKLSRPAYWS